MTKNSKLIKVLEHLTKGEEDAARDLLHTVFIEKARAIHEELMSADEAAQEEMEETVAEDSVEETMHDDMEETVGGSGDMGKDLTNEIEALENEIDFEETMNEREMGDMPADDMANMPSGDMPGGDMPGGDMPGDDASDMPGTNIAGGDMPAGEDHHDLEAVEQKMSDLEAALAELKAEFDKLEAEEAGEDEEAAGEDEEEAGEDEEEAGEDEEEAGEDEEEAGEEEGEMEESLNLDEDFDDLAESLNLEVVEKNMEKSAKTADEVGSGKSGMSKGEHAKSPLPASQTSRMGAKPVETGKGPTHNGFKLEAAPKSGQMAGTSDNRRKKSTQGMNQVKAASKGEVGSGHSGMSTGDKAMSPLSKGGQNLKAGK